MILFRRNKTIVIALIFLFLTIQITPVIQVNQNQRLPKQTNSNRFEFTSSNLFDEESLDQDYLVFASSVDEFSFFKENYKVTTEYSHLLALELTLSHREYREISAKSTNEILQSKHIRERIITQLESNQNHDNIKVNTIQDADYLKVSDLWNLGYNGTNVVVAVFDDGIDFNHSGLNGQDYSSPILFNEVGGQTEDPCRSHGTKVAGLIAGTENGGFPNYKGMAYGSKLVSMEMGCISGNDLFGDPIAGFDWLVSQNETIDIVNLSWGIGNGLVFDPIIDRLAEVGIITVASAGNDGPNEYTINDPGSAIGAITVGAVNDFGTPQSFSAQGPTPIFAIKPDIVAPGYNLITTQSLDDGGGYTTFTGTSGSTPLVSGAIATLISALDANSITWNVGTIKAALMRTATEISANEIKAGQGLVNLNATWEYLTNSISDDRGPQVLELTPSSGLPNSVSMLSTNITIDIPITLISSHPDLVNVEISGDISNILSFDGNIGTDYSQILPLQADTNNILPGIYTGYVNASIGNDFVVSEITFTVSDTYSKKVLVDLRHTNWDVNGHDYYAGSNTGEMVKIAKNQELWIQDSHSELTDELLEQFDILWMPDPFDLHESGANNAERLLQSEIDAINNFVDSGNSLFMDFLGTLEDNKGIFGTNSTEINSLISRYGITTKASPVSDLFEKTINPENSSNLVNGVPSVTHFGNYLEVDNNWQSVVANEIGTTVATYENVLGGRVLVSSTNFWLDNAGALGLYSSYGGLGDRELSHNVWKWLSSEDRITQSIDDNKFNVTFNLSSSIQNDSTPQINVLRNGNPYINDVIVNEIGDFQTFEVEFIEDDIYKITLIFGSEYKIWTIYSDYYLPIISPLSENQLGFKINTTLHLQFELLNVIIQDPEIQISTTLDSQKIETIIYNSETKIANVSIQGSLLRQSQHWYELEISVIDLQSNFLSFVYSFYVGEKPPSTAITSTSSILDTSIPSSKSSDSIVHVAILLLAGTIIIGSNKIRRRMK